MTARNSLSFVPFPKNSPTEPTASSRHRDEANMVSSSSDPWKLLTTKCPRRMFLCDALSIATHRSLEAAENKDDEPLFVRTMGTVVTRESSYWNDQRTFLLDDGTALMDVIWEGQVIQGVKRKHGKNALVSKNGNDDGSPCSNKPFDVVPGQLVDCVGTIQYVVTSTSSAAKTTHHHVRNHNLDTTTLQSVKSSTNQQHNGSCFLFAYSISHVPNQDTEALRIAEICSLGPQYTKNNNDTLCYLNNQEQVFIAGNLMSRIGTFRYTTTPTLCTKNNNGFSLENELLELQTKDETRKLQMDRTQVFDLIRCSSVQDGGLTDDDLFLLLGCGDGDNDDSDNYRRCVKDVLQDMQASGEIYRSMKGTYMPL